MKDFDAFKRPKKSGTFSEDMKKELKEIYHLYSLEELAEHFGTTAKIVKAQAERQYLSKKRKN